MRPALAYHLLLRAGGSDESIPLARGILERETRRLEEADAECALEASEWTALSAVDAARRIEEWVAARAREWRLRVSGFDRGLAVHALLQLAPTALIDGAWLQDVARVSLSRTPAGAALTRLRAFEMGLDDSPHDHPGLFRGLLARAGLVLDDAHTLAFCRDPRLLDFAFELPALLLALSRLPESHFGELLGLNLLAHHAAPCLAGRVLVEILPSEWARGAFFREHDASSTAVASRALSVHAIECHLGGRAEADRAAEWSRVVRGVRLGAAALLRWTGSLSAGTTTRRGAALAVPSVEAGAAGPAARGPTCPEAAALEARGLYHALLHREEFPGSDGAALAFLERRLERARSEVPRDPLLQRYDPHDLRAWIEQEHRTAVASYSGDRGAQGYSREQWIEACVQLTPTLLVDGAWLQGMGQACVQHEPASRQLFRVFYDEVGAGSAEQHHGNVYLALLAQMGVDPPPFDSREFAAWRRFSDSSFEAPVLWMSLARFPQRFLPETLGLNLSIELAGVGGAYLRAIDALRHHGFDPCFFELHEDADDPSVGHTAWSADALHGFMQRARARLDEEQVEALWARVLTGLALHAHEGPPARERWWQALLQRIRGRLLPLGAR